MMYVRFGCPECLRDGKAVDHRDQLANCITAWRTFWMTMLRRAEPAGAPAAIFGDTELALLERTAPALKRKPTPGTAVSWY